MQYTQEQLEEFMKHAYSYESREKHEAAGFATSFIGTVQLGNRLYDLFADTGGNFWYINRIITNKGIVSEYEAIFGHSEGKKMRR